MKERLYNNMIKDNIARLEEEIKQATIDAGRDPSEVTLMAVTKTVNVNRVNDAIAAGVTLLGESRAQELEGKYGFYNKENVDIHFIGTLQRNKVRHIIDKVSMIHSVDRISLAKEIDKRARAINKVMDVLVQVNIGKESTKSGILAEELPEFVEKIEEFPNLRLRGLMAIPPICETGEEQEVYFKEMQSLLVDIQSKNIHNESTVNVLSTGMSGDFVSAIRHGATIVRIGTAIFGQRQV